jgi:hypothetical protein
MSSFLDCLSKQHDLLDCVYRIRTARQKASTGSVNIARKCLVKSEKVKQPILTCKRPSFMLRKASFHALKGILSHDERHAFAISKHFSHDFIAHFSSFCAISIIFLKKIGG